MVKIEDLGALATERDAPRVSIFLPLHRVGPETRKDTIRLGNLITRAQQSLASDHAAGDERATLLEPARELLRQERLWAAGSSGLALFLSRDGMRTHHVTHRLPEKVVVSDRFHIRPLLPLLEGDGCFHILTLSQRAVRLYRADRDTIESVELRGAPEDLESAVGHDFEQKSLQSHALTGSSRGARRSMVFHGHGEGSDETKLELEKFFRRVDAALHDTLHGDRNPLVLAAVDYLMPIYRSISKHPHIVEKGVVGNPDAMPVDDLHARAWTLVEPRFDARRRAAIDQYRELGSGGGVRTGDTVQEVVPAAVAGRVDTLFLARDAECWGRYDPALGKVDVHDPAEPGDEDILDLAAAEAVARGAEVFVDGDEVPGRNGIAAIYRY